MKGEELILQSVDRFVGRTQNWLYDHLRFLPRYRQVVCAERFENRDEFPELDTWRRHYWTIPQRVWRRLTGRSLYVGDAIRLAFMKPDLLHSHFGHIGLADADLHRSLQKPWVVSFYGADAFQGSVETLGSQYAGMFDRADRILALGPFMKSRLEELGCAPDKVVVHPLGVDTTLISGEPRTAQPGEPLRLLFAGTFREKKGIPYIVEAAGSLKKRQVPFRLLLIGDQAGKSGDQAIKDHVFRRIKELGLEDSIEHRPFVPYEELMRLGRNHHVFLAPSVTAEDGDSEGTPFVLQQMMASGMPVISTRHSDIPFIFGSQEPLLFNERDATGIADRVQEYFESPELVEAHGRALRAEIEKKDVRICSAKLAEIYGELLP